MKKMICVCLIIAFIFAGCAHPIEVNGKTIHTYGLFNPDEKQNNIKYEVSFGNVVLSVIFFETAIVPVILLGWHLYEPIE